MIKYLLISLLTLISNVALSQIWIVEYKLCQNFEHPSNVSTVLAKQLNLIEYGGCYLSDTTITLEFDTFNKICKYRKVEYQITNIVSESDSTFEFLVKFKEGEFACVLSSSVEGKMVYLSERKKDNKIVGWFTIDPEVKKLK